MFIINIVGFDFAWFGLVYWGNSFIPVALLLLCLHFYFVSKKKISEFTDFEHTKINFLRFAGETHAQMNNRRTGNFYRWMDTGTMFIIELCAMQNGGGEQFSEEDLVLNIFIYRLVFNSPETMGYALNNCGGNECFRVKKFEKESFLSVVKGVQERCGHIRGSSFVVIYKNRSGAKIESDGIVISAVVAGMDALITVLKNHKLGEGASLLSQMEVWNEKFGGYIPPFALSQIALDFGFVNNYDERWRYVGDGAEIGIELALGRRINDEASRKEAFIELSKRLNENDEAVRIMRETCPVFFPGTKGTTNLYRFHTIEHGTCEWRGYLWNRSSSHLWSILGEWKGRGIQEFDMRPRKVIKRHCDEGSQSQRANRKNAGAQYTPQRDIVYEHLANKCNFIVNREFT